MLLTQRTYIGVDPAGSHRPFTYAAVDQECRLLAVAEAELEEILAFLSGQRSAVVAINAPPRPNAGLVKGRESQRTPRPQANAGRGGEMRVAEQTLREHGIGVAMTPSRADACAPWMRQGFALHQKLAPLGYVPYPAGDALYQVLESHPHAVFCTLLGQQPMSKLTLEGRLQRQLTLFEHGLGIHDPMDFFEEITRHRLLKGHLPLEQVYSAEVLDALSAALVAWIAGVHPGRVLMVGDPGEGQITLPVDALQSSY